MTRMQEMSLDYHFTVEQEVGSSTYAFFGFNGKSYVTAVALLINVTKSFIELKLSCIWHKLVCSNMKYILRYAAGTAGVWRIAALNEAGGWKDRTTVEDMDLAVRASLKGWEFLYLSSVKVICKLCI